VTHWLTHFEYDGFPVEKTAVGPCDLSVLRVGTEWRWLVRQGVRDKAEGTSCSAFEARREAEAVARTFCEGDGRASAARRSGRR
jgi:hypothetical protein